MPSTNSPNKSELKRSWYKQKKGLIATAIVVGLSIISVAVAVSLRSKEQASNNAVRFACGISPSDPVFNITSNIDLSDGMSKQEAVTVAETVYAKVSQAMKYNSFASLECDASANEDGIWTVKFQAVYLSTGYFEPAHFGQATRIQRENFEAIINPFDLTVAYSY